MLKPFHTRDHHPHESTEKPADPCRASITVLASASLTLITSLALERGLDEDGLELCNAGRQNARLLNSEVLSDSDPHYLLIYLIREMMLRVHSMLFQKYLVMFLHTQQYRTLY